MNMPGFTGYSSLYKMSGHYRAIVSTFNAIVDGRGAVPQSLALLKCLQGCHYSDSPDYCQQHCFWQEDIDNGGGGGGGGRGGGGQSCVPGCGPCHSDPDSPTGGYKSCVRHDCGTYDIACRTRPRGRLTVTD